MDELTDADLQRRLHQIVDDCETAEEAFSVMATHGALMSRGTRAYLEGAALALVQCLPDLSAAERFERAVREAGWRLEPEMQQALAQRKVRLRECSNRR